MIVGTRRLWLGAATLPISQSDVADVTNAASPKNAGHDEFIDNLSPQCDFSKSNPRNIESVNYGAFPKGMPTYNTYLHQNPDVDSD